MMMFCSPWTPGLTVEIEIDIHPYSSGNFQIGFCRGFIESQAFSRHFGPNNHLVPSKTELIFDITQNAGPRAKDKAANAALFLYF